MKFYLYNTLTRQKEEFQPRQPGLVKMYTCGPTVYDYAHIGNFRAYVFADVLRRSLEYFGFRVDQVMNITDVGHLTSDADSGEDKVEKTARETGKSAFEIARYYEEVFKKDVQSLNIKAPRRWCRATEHIPEQIALVKRLEELGFAYRTTDGVYFDTRKLSDYGKLARLNLEGLKPGARVKVNPEKRSPHDFALWLLSPRGAKRQMEWPSPWGVGFPGWHIECSALSMKYLSPETFGRRQREGDKGQVYETAEFDPPAFKTIDIHTGGVDHIPVHHTNEIAQSEAATGKAFVKYFLHNEFLLVEGEKMSKSRGNFYKLADIVGRGFDPLALRYLYLGSHYRSEMNFTWKGLEGAQTALERLRAAVAGWKAPRVGCAEYEEKFAAAIGDDLNLPEALAVLWDLVKSDYPSHAKRRSVLKFDRVLGLRLGEAEPYQAPEEVKKLVEEREKLRRKGKWEKADKLRREIEAKGALVEDTPEGPKIKIKKTGK
jgi:cysteinyl-tRNA synthetase